MATKEKLILEAAAEVFLKFGFKKTSIDDIAAHAGVGKGTIYNYFQSKEALFFRMAEVVQDEMDQDFKIALNRYRGKNDPLINHMIVRQLEARRMSVRYSMSIEVIAELLEIFKNTPDKIEEHVQQYIDILIEGVKDGRYTPADHRKQAMVLVDIGIQYLFKWLKMSEKEMEKAVKNILSVLLQGIAVKS